MKKYSILLFIIFCSVLFAQYDNNKNENYLSGANLISVTIGGNFVVTGTFPASSTERVDQFVTRLFNQGKEKLLATAINSSLRSQIYDQLTNYSFRNIKLKRSDGKELILDLEKFRLNGDFANNPYLKNDDVLIFSPTDLVRNFFTVSGAVNIPGKFHFVDGDKLKDAIEFAGGINKAYEKVTKAEINRLSYDGRDQKVEIVKINSDFELQRGDRIVVVSNETMKREFSVTVIGEVNSPGVVPITKDKTSLLEVINKAGGFTNAASLKYARLYTGNSVNSFNIRNYQLNPILDLTNNITNMEELRMLNMSNLVSEDTAFFKTENQLRVLLEGSTIDFTKLMDQNSEASKYLVKDRDLIIIPAQDNSVYVFGQVLSSGHIPYQPGQNYKYYIEKAGGLGDLAEKTDVMVIKGVNRNWIEAEKNEKIEEGDYIYVPKRPVRSFNSYVGQVGLYLGIVGSAATIILLLLQFKK
jgi:protein involved in polysaccharide export with SLBB domain